MIKEEMSETDKNPGKQRTINTISARGKQSAFARNYEAKPTHMTI